ncbi:MAG: MATE family efflux transporter [Propionicimonas sp.]|uniref:MATE family efflux transporter n=1 Tax=Propionicimonas sp. TaxID=1955623 RepID=UPI003D0A5E0F
MAGRARGAVHVLYRGGVRTPGSQSREILALAVPAFLALVAEPLFLLADTAIVGHLGTAQLAGLGVASSILVTAAGVFVFLAYGTTSVVARQVGAGDERAALASGLDGIWLALLLGVATALVVGFAAEPLCGVFGASPEAVGFAATYLRISAGGIPAMLAVLAATGALRGFQDTRTPLVASVLGFGANIALNLLLVLGLGWGIAGSAWGTVIAQTGMGVGLVAVVVRRALAGRAPLRPEPGRVLRAATTGVPLLVRTLALRAILLVTTWVAAGLGDVPLAAHQVAGTIWSFLAFVLDALAIAGQAITGKALGAGDVAAVRSATSTMLRWGVWAGVVLGALLVAVHGVLPALFTADPGVREALGAALVVIGLTSWLSGLVFVADGVLIGAGDGRWLAGAMAATLAAYLPLVLAVRWFTPWLAAQGAPLAVAVLWVVFTAFMAIRWAFLWYRVRGDGWLVAGASR